MTMNWMSFVEENLLLSGVVLIMLVMSLYSFMVMGWDKRLAKKGAWRVSEKQLLLAGLFFGGPGAWLGMKVFRHKTKHKQFQYGFPIMTILQIAFIFYLLFT